MSKASLKKELQNLTKEQIIEVVLDAYDARKETKEYFEFFLNPDVEKLTLKFNEAVAKEFRRSKWGYSKARASHLKKLLKEIAGYKLDAKVYVNAMLIMLQHAMICERFYHIGTPVENMMSGLVADTIKYSDRNLIADYAMIQLNRILTDKYGLPRRLAQLRRVIEDTCSELSLQMK